MGKIKLDDRLSAVASFVRKGSAVADIGTDHGYVITYLIENGICPKGVAADINQGPLDNAKKTVIESGIEDKVELILSDGLENIEKDSFDDVVIAGMGGNLIADILSAYPEIKNTRYNIVAQPMSHGEVLREFLCKNGFEIKSERVVADGSRLYCVINASFSGKAIESDEAYYYLGKLTENKDELSERYIQKIITAMDKKASALIKADKSEGKELKKLVDKMKTISGQAADVTVKEVSSFIDAFSPYKTKCSWDNCGLLVGNEENKVTKIGLALDLTSEVLKDAISKGVDLIVTHHPAIFKAQKAFIKGNIAYDAAVNGISVISSHTCLDAAQGGVNDVLCDVLELTDVSSIEIAEELNSPLLRIGTVKKTNPLDFSRFVSEKLSAVCRIVEGKRPIKRVAVCGGAGADFMDYAIEAGADAFVTGDLKHHEMLDAAEKGITLIAAGHFETENPVMSVLKERLEKEFPQLEMYLLRQSKPVKYIGLD